MTKYYRVIKENPLWEVGAILGNTVSFGGVVGYEPLEDIWNRLESQNGEYLSAKFIEEQPEYFERVYKSIGDKLKYVTQGQLKKAYEGFAK